MPFRQCSRDKEGGLAAYSDTEERKLGTYSDDRARCLWRTQLPDAPCRAQLHPSTARDPQGQAQPRSPLPASPGSSHPSSQAVRDSSRPDVTLEQDYSGCSHSFSQAVRYSFSCSFLLF